MQWAAIFWLTMFLAPQLLGTSEASEACGLLSRLAEMPGINIVQINDNSYLLTIEYLDGVCNKWFDGNCMSNPPYGDCKKDGTCCPGDCGGCWSNRVQSLCQRKYALQALYTVLIARGNARRKSMNKILEILLVVCLSIASAGATSLSDQIASITDGQTISVDGYQTLSDLSVPQNLTLLGKGDESVLKVDSFFMAGDHKRLLLKNLVIKDCLRIHSYADVVAENCRFENASLYVWDASLYAKDCVFTGGRMKTCSDDGER